MGASRILRSLLGAALVAAAATTGAQSYPSKPIRFIAPFPPGGSSDVLCQLLGQKLSEVAGQPVVVENRAGASGNIGHEFGAKQPADGYTRHSRSIRISSSVSGSTRRATSRR